MRFVDRPHCRPMRCAAMPNIGQTTPTRWIDTGSELNGFDNHVYLSEVAVTEAARMFGWVPPGDVRSLVGQLKAAKADLADARKKVARQSKTIDAIELVRAETKRERVTA